MLAFSSGVRSKFWVMLLMIWVRSRPTKVPSRNLTSPMTLSRRRWCSDHPGSIQPHSSLFFLTFFAMFGEIGNNFSPCPLSAFRLLGDFFFPDDCGKPGSGLIRVATITSKISGAMRPILRNCRARKFHRFVPFCTSALVSSTVAFKSALSAALRSVFCIDLGVDFLEEGGDLFSAEAGFFDRDPHTCHPGI